MSSADVQITVFIPEITPSPSARTLRNPTYGMQTQTPGAVSSLRRISTLHSLNQTQALSRFLSRTMRTTQAVTLTTRNRSTLHLLVSVGEVPFRASATHVGN